MNLIIRFLLWLARRNGAPRVISGRGEGETPYLTRYFLTKNSYSTEGMGFAGRKPPRWGLYLHHFTRSDDAGELHNHPWQWSVSLILKGSYSEERRKDFARCPFKSLHGCLCSVVRRHFYYPGSLNVITANDFHRVDLVTEDVWTLFLVGPVVQSWGFWSRGTLRFTPWRKFLGLEK